MPLFITKKERLTYRWVMSGEVDQTPAALNFKPVFCSACGFSLTS